jgi:hypothetical protein
VPAVPGRAPTSRPRHAPGGRLRTDPDVRRRSRSADGDTVPPTVGGGGHRGPTNPTVRRRSRPRGARARVFRGRCGPRREDGRALGPPISPVPFRPPSTFQSERAHSPRPVPGSNQFRGVINADAPTGRREARFHTSLLSERPTPRAPVARPLTEPGFLWLQRRGVPGEDRGPSAGGPPVCGRFPAGNPMSGNTRDPSSGPSDRPPWTTNLRRGAPGTLRAPVAHQGADRRPHLYRQQITCNLIHELLVWVTP